MVWGWTFLEQSLLTGIPVVSNVLPIQNKRHEHPSKTILVDFYNIFPHVELLGWKWGLGTSLAVQWLILCLLIQRVMSSIPSGGAKFPHALWPTNQNINQKQHCNKTQEQVHAMGKTQDRGNSKSQNAIRSTCEGLGKSNPEAYVVWLRCCMGPTRKIERQPNAV